MAVQNTQVCQGCGQKRGKDHCVFPSNRGPNVTNPNHPSNTGESDELFKSLMSVQWGKRYT